MALTEAGYREFSAFLEKSSGICLGENKQYLVSSRLRGILKEKQLTTIDQLIDILKKDVRGELKSKVIDAMTTNETLWFRDAHPFEILRNTILPEMKQQNRHGLSIWSAACSTGQEPYSISIILEEFKKKNPKYSITGDKILATDISHTALSEAKSGEYAMLALGRGLDPAKMKLNFTELDSGRWKINSSIASRVNFRSLNLKDSYSSLGKFDIIFCRNVLIYFTAELKKDILSRMHSSLKPGGYLMVGASEAVSGLNDKYEMVHCRPGIVYRAI